jgi:hypothetical protein
MNFREETLVRVREGHQERTGALYWLEECTRTFDEHWQDKGLGGPHARFPKHDYWPAVFWEFAHSKRLFIPKSREMMLTWAAVG